MKVILAGFNTDRQFGSDTPETISAAYARISRDPRPVWELREEAAREVAGARRSNSKIVFGFGHSSVAEHAVFNLDIAGISRFAAEALQSFRLASFTEKSQRYIRLDSDWVTPGELSALAGNAFDDSCRELFGIYGELIDVLLAEGVPGESAKEDARYVLPLCASCQMGMTANARELEHMMRRLAAWPVLELRKLAGEMAGAVVPVAPSLFRHTDPVPVDSFAAGCSLTPRLVPARGVTLLAGDSDRRVGVCLLAVREGLPHTKAAILWRELAPAERESLFSESCAGLGSHDAMPRIWETARFIFELSVSSTAFAQLKRHRMATISASAPYAGSGLEIPPTFSGARARKLLAKAGSISERCSATLPDALRPAILLNAHRRAVLVSMNAREMIHFSRLREDAHAQWDIRAKAGEMLALARRRAPLTLAMACGKSDFLD